MMGKVILVTGGSRSGKSTFAENMLKDEDEVLYIATAIATDGEMEERINRHKERRNTNWSTYEGYKNFKEKISTCEEKYVLLDCVTVMTTNLIFDNDIDIDNLNYSEKDELITYIKNEFFQLISAIREENKTLVMVTNEVGWGLVSEYKLGRLFTDIAGLVNQYIATLSDEVYLVACGLPLKLK